MFETVVPRNVRLAEAPSFGKPIILYDVQSIGAQAYMGVARELLERQRAEGAAAARGAGTIAHEPAAERALDKDHAPAAGPGGR